MTKNHNSSITYWNIGALIVLMTLTSALFGSFGVAHADSGGGTSVEINIGSNGGTLVRGAQVTSVSGNDVSAKTSLGASVMNWIVKTDSNTEFTANKNGGSGLANIAVGDIISFRGSLDQAVSGLTVKAKVVKDWTHVQTKKNFSGVVSSINTSLNSFVITNGNSTTTVQTNSDTKFKLDGSAGTFASLFLNAKVKVMGMFNASSSVLTATSVDIASTTKDKWTKNDAHEWRDWIRSKIWLSLGH